MTDEGGYSSDLVQGFSRWLEIDFWLSNGFRDNLHNMNEILFIRALPQKTFFMGYLGYILTKVIFVLKEHFNKSKKTFDGGQMKYLNKGPKN